MAQKSYIQEYKDLKLPQTFQVVDLLLPSIDFIPELRQKHSRKSLDVFIMYTALFP